MMRYTRLSRNIQPLSEFRANAAGFLQQVRESRSPLILTQHGRAAAVLLHIDEYERLLDEIELLREVRLAEQQLSDNQGVEHAEAKSRLVRSIRQ